MVIEKDGDNAFRVRRTYLSFDMSDVYNGKTKTYKQYTFEYAGREECLLYGDDDNKLLSWIRLGLR